MSDLYWLTDEQMDRLQPFFPKSHGKPRVDDCRVLSGIIFVNRNGLRWRDAPREYGPHKTLYNRWKRWSAIGIFIRMMEGLATITPGRLPFWTLCHQPNGCWQTGAYDADWFRKALEKKGGKPCIPGRKSRGRPIKYDKRKYKRRNRIEIMFGRLKDWRRVSTRYDRCQTVFFSAICLAATVLFWL